MKAICSQQSVVSSQKTGYRIRTLIVLALIFMLCTVSPMLFVDKASAELTLDINHGHIKIDFLYHGSKVSVKGTADKGTDLVVKIASPDGHESLRKKGKVAGILWMNVGRIKFENVPSFYSLHSTEDIREILDATEMDKYGIGYSSLKRHIEITPVTNNEEEKDRWFDEFVKFKESSKLYATSSGKISTDVKNENQNYYIRLDWPYQAPPGEYTVIVYAIKDKKVIEKAEVKVLVEQAGIVKTLANMAKNHGALYGIISIVVALAAGFGVGMIFRKGGGSH